VPHVEVSYPAPAAQVAELAADEPAHLEAPADVEGEQFQRRRGFFIDIEAQEPVAPDPLPPSPRKRTRPKAEKAAAEPRGDNIIPFSAKKPTHSDVLALMASGKTQKQIAAIFGCTDRTIRNILSGKRAAQSAISFTA
jgi:hypothetical protein